MVEVAEFASGSVLDLPVTAVSGVGDRVASQLKQLGIERVFDLLLHLPRDYEDRSRLVAIGQVQNGVSALVRGRVVRVEKKRHGMTVLLTDDSGVLALRFFKVYANLEVAMVVGAWLQVFGEVKINAYGVQMHHPEYQVIGANAPQDFTQSLLPIYPTVKGLHQNKIRLLIRSALQWVQNQGLPLSVFNEADWQAVGGVAGQSLSLFEALTLIHMPPLYADMGQQGAILAQMKDRSHPACRRLIIEEMTAYQLSLLYRRQQLQVHKAPLCVAKSDLADRLLASLPFRLTKAQSRVSEEIVADLSRSIPMLRLVQGDVGAGKTLVAALAACHAIDSGWQVAIMAPTEILAEQHFLNFQQWFEPLGVSVVFLAGKLSTKARQQALHAIGNNEADLVIGTHALFQEEVAFAKLGLVVIDEQHRFGVEQRLALTDKGLAHAMPHQLVMTATPIPRTLAMSAYGDMDTSIIDELPPNRTPVTTVTIDRNRRDEVIERIAINCQQGKQAYWVCPLVEESTSLDAQAAEATFADLSQRLNIPIGLVHGKMKAQEKQSVMQAFKAGDLALLVATTVIEVGVDVPNASLMVIENAERLGLSQLHQLRGRVGRGAEKSFCVLLYQTPLSETSIERLNILRDSNDGFIIAQKDLALRGPGELLGKRQTGNIGYYISDLIRDQTLLETAHALGKRLIADPKRKQDVQHLIQRWLPDAKKYTHV